MKTQITVTGQIPWMKLVGGPVNLQKTGNGIQFLLHQIPFPLTEQKSTGCFYHFQKHLPAIQGVTMLCKEMAEWNFGYDIYITAVANIMIRIFLATCGIVKLMEMMLCRGVHMKMHMMPASTIDVRYACTQFITATQSADKPMFLVRGTGHGQSP